MPRRLAASAQPRRDAIGMAEGEPVNGSRRDGGSASSTVACRRSAAASSIYSARSATAAALRSARGATRASTRTGSTRDAVARTRITIRSAAIAVAGARITVRSAAVTIARTRLVGARAGTA